MAFAVRTPQLALPTDMPPSAWAPRRGVAELRRAGSSAARRAGPLQFAPRAAVQPPAEHCAPTAACPAAVPTPTRRAALGMALACGCGGPLLLRPRRADALLVSPVLEPRPDSWSNDDFASAMEGGMADYERGIAPLKAALFRSPDVIGPGAAVCEIGCGTGPSLRYFGAAACVVGVEPNMAMHPRAQASADAAGLGDRFRLVTATGEALPFPDASFDVVVGAPPLRPARLLLLGAGEAPHAPLVPPKQARWCCARFATCAPPWRKCAAC
jgi:hypothetical protein